MTGPSSGVYVGLAGMIVGTIAGSPISTVDAHELPEISALRQNYPNPFNPTTAISYQLLDNSFVKLEVFDMLGRQIATLVDGEVTGGYHTVTFDATRYPSGIYYYRLQVRAMNGGKGGGFVETKKMILLK